MSCYVSLVRSLREKFDKSSNFCVQQILKNYRVSQKAYSPTCILKMHKNFGKLYKKCSVNLIGRDCGGFWLKKFIDFYSDMSQEFSSHFDILML